MTQQLNSKGYIHVYTGNGKGKTTAALGIAFRGIGWGLKSYIGQFMKGQPYGELTAALHVEQFMTIEQFGTPTMLHITNNPTEEDILRAHAGLKKAENAMLSMNYHIVILDEINIANSFNLISTKEILQFMKIKPYAVELILTGRHASEEIIQAADLVSEIVEIKHYFHQGILARSGIER
jgi:cob(I)alamin adenosyltransferase